MLRTHTCGELNKNHLGQKVTLCGWVLRIRDHGTLTFAHLRDRYGITQIISDSTTDQKLHIEIKKLNREDCIKATGEVVARKPETINKDLATGEIEIKISEIEMLNKSKLPPFEIDDRTMISDDLRLKYRYLDLRRDRMQKNIILRHNAIGSVRKSMTELGFLEVETPLFVRSTPEGARDFVVPSRLYSGKFYALPQSPQLYKQLLMVSGFDRYFQFAPCFRDEDLRADRAFVHTQIDMEMTFVEEKDVFHAVEHYVKNLFQDVLGIKVKTPFKIMPYSMAMDKYGIDKPDLRFELELEDLTEIAKKSESKIFKDVIGSGGIVKAITAKGCGKYSRKEIEALEEVAKIYGAQGLFYTKVAGNKLETGIAKFFCDATALELINHMNADDNDLILVVADKANVANASLGNIRNKLGKDLKLINKNEYQFLWVNNFPLFEYNEEAKKWDPMHHLFTMPLPDHLKYLDSDPGKIHGQLYDLVLNGVELLSGSIRINRPDIQKKVFDIIKMSEEEAKSKFGFLLEAFTYGAPPHGGCAMGFDRMVAIMAGEETIREVIAFPNNASGVYPIDGSPSWVSEEQLKELKLKITK